MFLRTNTCVCKRAFALSKLKELHADRGNTLLTFFRLQDEDSQNNMSSAILGALFRNLMFHRTGEAVHGDARTPHMAQLNSLTHSLREIYFGSYRNHSTT